VLPAGVAKAGSNVVAIRMYGLTQDAAFTGETKGMGFPVAEPASLDSSWKFKVEAEFPPLSESAKAALPVAPSAQLRNTATTLFNGMIHPLIPYAIRGVIWYQGESNVGNASTYKQRLKLFIADLRKHWDNPKMPFYIVQLANYYGTHPEPIDSRIAAVRQAQFETVRETPATGMAVAIDVGEVGIHPKRKKPVGERLALVALSQTYGMPGEYSGPLYLSARIEGDKMRISFEHTTGGLVAKGGALKQFAIADEDKKFVWADAVINGNTVVVSSPKAPKPVAVRYAWDDNPEGCNLYNGADLPASPFRTDNW
jgi:sialate O-acetylesterase